MNEYLTFIALLGVSAGVTILASWLAHRNEQRALNERFKHAKAKTT